MALEYGVIVGRYRSTIASPPDDDDDIPNLEPLVGTIILDPRPEVILVDDTAAEGAMTITPMPTRVQLNADGDLTHNGKPYVKLLSPESSSIDTHDWTYEVSFDLRTLDGQPVRMNSYDIFVKASNTVERPLDLTKATPVIRNTGTQTIIGPSNVLSIGKVVSGPEAQAIITGTSPEQTLDLVLPRGETGLTPQIEIGTVETVANPADAAWIAQLILAGGPVMTDALKAVLPATMKGDKGDAGGWTIGNNLGTTNLNTITSPGLYRTEGTVANMVSTLNYPSAVTGVLEVTYRSLNRIVQKFYPQSGGGQDRVFWTRSSTGDGSAWMPWVVYASQRVDNTAGRAIYTWDDVANREQLIYGDTGWRNISNEPVLLNDFTAASMQLRRVDSSITLNFDAMKSATASGNSGFIALPVGFRPDLTNGSGNQRYNTATELTGLNPTVISPEPAYGSSVNPNLRFLHYVATRTLHGSVTFYTRDPWPTSLPGTAIGAIPPQ